jgi:Uma2 family endonuclease
MSVATQRLITAEEFLRMPDPPDGSRQELVRGVIETLPPPSTYHGVCCLEIGYRLRKFVGDQQLGFIASNDSGFITERDPDTVRGPDLSFWSRQRLPQLPAEGYVTVAPDLVVEVVSPNDVFSRVQKKIQHYLKHEVKLIWLVLPEDPSVTVYRPQAPLVTLTNSDVLSGEDVLPGFACPVQELFPA